MSNNTYGTVKQALFNPATDADIYYSYKKSRVGSDGNKPTFTKIDDVSSILSNASVDVSVFNDKRLPGMYDLKLPVSIFGNTGIYTVYIVPKGVQCTISYVGVLTAYPDIRGIVIDLNNIKPADRVLFQDDNLKGWMVEYFDYNGNSGTMLQEYYRYVTSNTYCEPVAQNNSTSNTNSYGFRYNTNGSLCFITLTPSTTQSFKSNAKPYIGTPNQNIIIKNTKFDPVCLEIEITDHDIETISYMLEGEQVRNLENGRLSFYNFDGEIYKQYEYSTIKDNYARTNIAEAKLDKTNNIDTSIDIETIRNA